ncbi:MAG TPA: hypothetical protein VN456_00805 [Desulfosporosinus sp.]|nr:hypothetical protein [Desulfosporosinus sp.]
MVIKNQEIRLAIVSAGLKQWQVAEAYGIHEGNFSRLLRKELNENEKNRVFSIIQALKNVEIKQSCV